MYFVVIYEFFWCIFLKFCLCKKNDKYQVWSSEEITATNLMEVEREENEESDEGQIGITPVAGMDYNGPGKKWAPIPGIW